MEEVMRKRDGVELSEDKFEHIIRVKLGEDDGISNSGIDIAVDAEGKVVHKRRRTDKDDIIVFRELLEHEAEPAEDRKIHKMGVIDKKDDLLAVAEKRKSFFNEAFFASEMGA